MDDGQRIRFLNPAARLPHYIEVLEKNILPVRSNLPIIFFKINMHLINYCLNKRKHLSIFATDHLLSHFAQQSWGFIKEKTKNSTLK